MDTQSVTVEITKETSTVTQAGFGKPLILSTGGKQSYKEYGGISEISKDFNEKTETYKLAKAIWAQTPKLPTVAVYGIDYSSKDKGKPSDLTSALNDLVTKHDDWYFLLSTAQADEDIKKLGSWINTQNKLYFASTDNKSLADSMQSEKAVVMYHTNPTSYPAAAWVGKCAPKDPGSLTWKFKTLNGISPVDIDAAELRTIHDNKANTYVNVMGNNQTSEGQSTTGEYIDILRGIDWLRARMKENTQMVLINNDKVTFDNDGISKIESAVREILREAVSRDIIATDEDGNGLYNLDVPNRSEISKTKVANRILPDVDWTATIAGAVHDVDISGTLKY